MNTATYRGMARNAEKRLEWSAAAAFWALAINKYPNKGSLAALDIAKMTQRKNAAALMALRETAA